MNCSLSCFKNNAVNVNSPSCEQNLMDIEIDDQKLEETIDEKNIVENSSPPTHFSCKDAEASVVGVSRRYYSVVSFPDQMKFRLKVNNKILSKKWNDWTTQHQNIIFKRKIKEWRGIAEDKIIIVPEFNAKGNMHYNLTYESKMSVKDIDITITDAYSVDHKSRKYFVNTSVIRDEERLKKYLKKDDGKGYQKTGLSWEIQNV